MSMILKIDSSNVIISIYYLIMANYYTQKEFSVSSLTDGQAGPFSHPWQNGMGKFPDKNLCALLVECQLYSWCWWLRFSRATKPVHNMCDYMMLLAKWFLDLIDPTRTTRTPAFWGYPPPPRDYPYYWPVHFESQVHTIDQFISDPKSKEGESRKN